MKENQNIMTAKASGSRKLKRKSLPKFDHAIYSKISSINLIIYSVHYLLEHGIEVRMEDVVFGCFLLFPHKFGLKKYSRWPDSAVVSRRVSDCRGKGYIAANTDFGFKLTVKGIRVAERVARALGVVKPKKIIIPPVKEKKAKTPPPSPVKKHVAPPAIQTIPVEKAAKLSPTPVEKAAIRPADSTAEKADRKTPGGPTHITGCKKGGTCSNAEACPSLRKETSRPHEKSKNRSACCHHSAREGEGSTTFKAPGLSRRKSACRKIRPFHGSLGCLSPVQKERQRIENQRIRFQKSAVMHDGIFKRNADKECRTLQRLCPHS